MKGAIARAGLWLSTTNTDTQRVVLEDGLAHLDWILSIGAQERDGYAAPDGHPDDGFSPPGGLKDLPDLRPIWLIFPEDREAHIRAIASPTIAKMTDPCRRSATRSASIGPIK